MSRERGRKRTVYEPLGTDIHCYKILTVHLSRSIIQYNYLCCFPQQVALSPQLLISTVTQIQGWQSTEQLRAFPYVMILARIIILTPAFNDFVLARCKHIMFESVYVCESFVARIYIESNIYIYISNIFLYRNSLILFEKVSLTYVYQYFLVVLSLKIFHVII